ncbi:Tyrosine recombinase XerD [Marinobacterium sp. xm-g-59]|uniref:tyrosine-type recombinase/integrase n=1 Tax=Marinobacterium sp. xm-g-59 TaxID=2497748 RepID=UPI001568718A|nr:tyrosine-type recombinase/integrase [Marinobacterium sp. xm-g-59]NRP94784.1 Tyrosine recombinase XerD [Marinobacterium sp. xm-g-59]
MIDEILASFDGAFAENTLRAYRSDFTHYEKWCASHDWPPIPATADRLALYIEEMSNKYKSATIRRRFSSLSSLFYLTKSPNPVNEPEVTLAMKRMHRQIGRAQKQASPLTLKYLEQMKRKCDNSNRGMRDKVLLQLGYETMRRRSEICAFKFEDLEQMPNGKYSILLRQSKTDQFAQGRLIPISDTLAKLIIKWQSRVGVNRGRILRSIRKDDAIGDQLSSASMCNILVDLQYRSRLRHLPNFSGHSFRVGAALDLLERGVPLEKIMLRGGWGAKSTALKYLASWIGSDMDVYSDDIAYE